MSVEKNVHHQIIEDNKLWRKDQLVSYLYDCLMHDRDAVIDFHLEGSCCDANGMYRLLDEFCQRTGYAPERVTIKTANMLEQHDRYRIVRVPEYWYEVRLIKQWAIGKHFLSGTDPHYHFGNFIGRSSWYRVWLAAWLNAKFSTQTLQTFNSALGSNYIVKEHRVDYLGLEDLVQHGCDILPAVIEFLQSCPRTIPEDHEYIKTVRSWIPQSGHYPIQHPANLNIINQYQHIFLDVICETRVSGNVFFVTEKTWRCILAGRPFVVMGSWQFLENLRKLGFQTFSQWWDEGYDDYSMGDRVHQITHVLDHIAQWSQDRMHRVLTEMQPVLKHNQALFRELTYQKIADTFNGK